jgi:hypothetical protein
LTGRGGLHGARTVPRIHPGDARLCIPQVSAQELADPLRRHRHLGGQRRPPPQQAGIHTALDASPHPGVNVIKLIFHGH